MAFKTIIVDIIKYDIKSFLLRLSLAFKIMVVLTNSFLVDLEDLFNNEKHNEDIVKVTNGNEDLAEAAILNYNDLNNVVKLQKSKYFHDIIKKVDDAMMSGLDSSSKQLVLDY